MSEPLDPARYAVEALAHTSIDVAAAESGTLGQSPKVLVEQAVQEIARAAPPGWESLHTAFSMAGGEEIASVTVVGSGDAIRLPVTSAMIAPIRVHRRISAGSRGPWLRLLFDCSSAGALQVSFDYGDEELPVDQLLPRDAYLRDLEEFPREDVALWLLAYIGNDGQQFRTASAAREASTPNIPARQADDEIPPMPILWARIAALAAVCRGSNTPVGPRTDPAFELFIGDHGGCTLARLPGGRAVLSGGRNDSQLLAAAYRGAIEWPDLYRGSPPWVHNLYLDPRASRGLLSFCYWWNGQHWYRSDLREAEGLSLNADLSWKPSEEIAKGVPGIWSTETTTTLIVGVLRRIGIELSDQNAYAVSDFVRLAEAGAASERYVVRMFSEGVPKTFDLAEALAQLDAADVLLPAYPAIDQETAIELVVQHCQKGNVDTWNFPLNKLVAARMDTGWQVFLPVEPDEIAIGRTVFLAADDGVVDQASTSAPPSQLALTFASRFAARVRARGVR